MLRVYSGLIMLSPTHTHTQKLKCLRINRIYSRVWQHWANIKKEREKKKICIAYRTVHCKPRVYLFIYLSLANRRHLAFYIIHIIWHMIPYAYFLHWLWWNAPESAIPTRDLYQFVFRNIEPVETSCEKNEVLNINASWALSRWFITDIWVKPMYN